MFHRPPNRRRTPAAILTLFLLGAAPAPAPRRIVSLDLCADQLVIALADRDRIAGVTEWARDPSLSYYAARARALPFTRRSAEEVIARAPDLVIGAPARTRAILAPLGMRLVAYPQAEDYAGLVRSISAVAAAVGHPDRGAAMIAGMDAELARSGPAPGRGRVAAYYQRQGYLSGSGTLVDDMMRRAGLANLARSPLSQLGLEQMARARPAFLVTAIDARRAADRGSAMLRHPLLDRIVPASHRLVLPQALTVCATPGYPRAVAMLIRQIRAADASAISAPRR